MPTTETIEVKDLSLDLKNYRTVPQKTEAAALHAMVSISPDWFWGLMDSLLEDGYHPTENIIVQKAGRTLTVREGNRRIAALKLAHGLLRGTNLAIPQNIKDRIKALPTEWKQQNLTVPCAVYAPSEKAAADRVVSLTHGKADKAGRRPWEAVAKARHNRDEEGGSEPGLDLLEAYLRSGKNLSGDQAERWSGSYPLTVLDEAVKRLAPRLSLASSREVANAYPKKLKAAFDAMLFDIGMGGLQFSGIRDQHTDFAAKYGFPPPPAPPAPAPSPSAGGSGGGAGGSGGGGARGGSPAAPSPGPAPSGGPSTAPARKTGTAAVASTDPRSVTRKLKAFRPIGANREKLVDLLTEARALKLANFPLAFCFLLRSMFEISAKAYCADHKASGGPKSVGRDGKDRPLVDTLRDITNHLTNNNADQEKKRLLHGAMTELASPNSILSVTSMNQLVHNPTFSVREDRIAAMFHNIFPLLEEMNK